MTTKNENISYQKKCKICGNTNLKKVLFIDEQYISATFVKSNKNNDLTKIKTPLTLILCSENSKKTFNIIWWLWKFKTYPNIKKKI